MEQSEARAAMDELALQQLQMYPHLSSIMGQVQVHHVSSFCVQRVNKSDNVRPSLSYCAVFLYTGLVPIRVLSYHDLPDFWGVHFLAVVCVCGQAIKTIKAW